MKKTIIGQILGILLVWALYGVYLTRVSFYEAFHGAYLEFGDLLLLFVSVAILIAVCLLLFWNSMRGEKIKGFRSFMVRNLAVTEDDEREKKIVMDANRKSYYFTSNTLILVIAALSFFMNKKMISAHTLILTLVIGITFETMLFLFYYIKKYND